LGKLGLDLGGEGRTKSESLVKKPVGVVGPAGIQGNEAAVEGDAGVGGRDKSRLGQSFIGGRIIFGVGGGEDEKHAGAGFEIVGMAGVS